MPMPVGNTPHIRLAGKHLLSKCEYTTGPNQAEVMSHPVIDMICLSAHADIAVR